MTRADELSALLDEAPAAVLSVDMNGQLRAHNRKTLEWMGHGEKTLVGRNLAEWLPPAARLLYETQIVPRLIEKGRVRELVLEIRRPDGRRHPLLVNADRLVDAAGRSAFESELVQLRRQADAAHRELLLLQEATGRLAVAGGLDDLGRILCDAAGTAAQAAWTSVRILAEDGAVSTWGVRPVDLELDDRLSRATEQVICRDPEEIERRFADSASALGRAGVESMIMTPIVRADGQAIGEICCWFRRPRTLGPDEAGTLTAIARQAERVVEHLRLQDRLRHSASHDSLTGLANRVGVTGLLDGLLAASASCAVLFLDLDGFKAINDLRGHRAGDEVLTVVASRLRGVCRARDAVGRLGGDEFLIACGELSADAAATLAERIRDAVSAPLAGAAEGMPLSASIGVIAWSADAAARPRAEELIAAADEEMYSAKRAARGGVRIRRWQEDWGYRQERVDGIVM